LDLNKAEAEETEPVEDLPPLPSLIRKGPADFGDSPL
jgi:hypothetical protein